MINIVDIFPKGKSERNKYCIYNTVILTVKFWIIPCPFFKKKYFELSSAMATITK